jgi:CheY-like chemotaxis protein
MTSESPPPEHRRHARSEVVATAVVFSAGQMHGNFLLQDLSAGGACLMGHLDTSPGQRLTVLLHFPGTSPFSVTAVVVRHDALGPTRERTAVTFTNLSPEQEDAIQEAIVATLERERARQAATVLVISPDDDSRNTLEHDLRALGVEAVSVATPLEALGWLERPDGRIAIIVVDVSPGAPQGLDVLDFVGENHPRIKRVVMADEMRPLRLDLAVRSGRAHRVLRKPWNRRGLEEALGELPPVLAGEE